jgi:alkylation response protein AidB-like acyl-CoA dehydrogenase
MAAEGAIAKQLRKYRDMNCKDGFGHALWRQFGEMGFTGILVDEADGGLGLGHVEAGIVLEEIGRNLTPSPFLVTAVAVVEALAAPRSGSAGCPASSPARRWRRWRSTRAQAPPESIAMRAERSGNGFRLTGRKQFVVQGASADFFVVARGRRRG